MNRRGGLGRGLAALIPPGEAGEGGGPARATLVELALDAIERNPRQPREVFDEQELEGLATSIRDIGVLQPIVVRPLGDDRYELVAGERRLRASKRAGLERIPAVVRHTEDGQLLKEALVENIHRVQLNPLEEAAAYAQLLEDFGFTQEELATTLGKSRPAISNALRLMQLPPDVQRRVAAGVLSAGHAKALLALPTPELMDKLATRTVAEGLSVRALEELVRLQLLEPRDPSAPARSGSSNRLTAPGLVELQDDLSDALMARVRISMGARRGKVQIEFRSVDDLERIVGVIARGLEDDPEDPDAAERVEAATTAVAGSASPASHPAADPASVERSDGAATDAPTASTADEGPDLDGLSPDELDALTRPD
ncbi:ParB/RepB/Spo0J family partition protein [Nitriliruptoraceae bacterium ZYF776]|nr:ParB/RepB/Spo0J family partition protein [Profundirhabdus halotolerans]